MADHIADFSLAYLEHGARKAQCGRWSHLPNGGASDRRNDCGSANRVYRAAAGAGSASCKRTNTEATPCSCAAYRDHRASRRRICDLAALFSAPEIPDSIVVLSGRIEGDDSAVASKTTGRILEVRVREGDSVDAGDVIAVLDDAQVRARQEQAQAALMAAEARTASARAQISILEQQLRQNQLLMEQSKVDAEGRVRQAQADLAAAEADLAQQEASLKLALFDKEAYTRLAQTESRFRAPGQTIGGDGRSTGGIRRCD